MNPRASTTPRPRSTGQGNGTTRAIWLHLLHHGGPPQRPQAIYQALAQQLPDLTRAHTAQMLARMAAAGQVCPHHSATGRRLRSYTVDATCTVPYGLIVKQIAHALSSTTAVRPMPTPTVAVHIPGLDDDTIKRIREEFSRPYQPQRERA